MKLLTCRQASCQPAAGAIPPHPSHSTEIHCVFYFVMKIRTFTFTFVTRMTKKLIDCNTVDIEKGFWIFFVCLYQIVPSFLYLVSCVFESLLREEGKNALLNI